MMLTEAYSQDENSTPWAQLLVTLTAKWLKAQGGKDSCFLLTQENPLAFLALANHFKKQTSATVLLLEDYLPFATSLVEKWPNKKIQILFWNADDLYSFKNIFPSLSAIAKALPLDQILPLPEKARWPKAKISARAQHRVHTLSHSVFLLRVLRQLRELNLLDKASLFLSFTIADTNCGQIFGDQNLALAYPTEQISQTFQHARILWFDTNQMQVSDIFKSKLKADNEVFFDLRAESSYRPDYSWLHAYFQGFPIVLSAHQNTSNLRQENIISIPHHILKQGNNYLGAGHGSQDGFAQSVVNIFLNELELKNKIR